MSYEFLKITPKEKAEAWKFSPKSAFSKNLFKKPLRIKLNEVKNTKLALGPSAQQFQILSLSELEEEGYLKIKILDQSIITNEYTKRALVDSTISNLFNGLKTLSLTLLKPLPSTLWISPNENLKLVDFNLAPLVKQSICLFEADIEKKYSEGFLFNFNVCKEAHLEIGICTNTSSATFSRVNIETKESAKVDAFTLLTGNIDYKRLEVNVYQSGHESEVSLNGICFAKNTSTLEFYSNIFHLNKNQNTTQIYKTLCSQKGKAVFGGRIHLTEEASGAFVRQLNNNLLLDKNSSVDTQPELNIHQDNVKASHGATTITVNDDHLFYFASRGLKADQSKQMLFKAFCKSSFSNLKNNSLINFFTDTLNKELEHVK